MTTKSLSYGNVFQPRQFFLNAIGDDGKYDSNGHLNENPYTLVMTDRIWVKKLQTAALQTNGLPGRMARVQKEKELTFKVQSKISESVKGHQFHLGKFLGEGKQSFAMTVDAIRDISRAAHEVRHGNVISAARILTGSSRHRPGFGFKGFADRWLELQYGWLPLYKDVFEAWKAFAVVNDVARITRLHVRTTDLDTMNVVIDQYYDNMIQYKGRAVVIIKLKEQLSTARSLGLYDPLGVAWEITPWSFMMDWFLPIGSYLENLNTIPNINGTFYITTTCKYMTNIKWKAFNFAQGKRGDHQFTYQVYMTRKQMDSQHPVFPSFVSLPDAMSPKRMYNAIALGAQRIGKG